MATPAEILAESLAKARTANRIDGTKNSYRRDNPTEYANVIAYLDGGARPSGVTSDMGLHLVLEEDARRALGGSPPPPPPSGVTSPLGYLQLNGTMPASNASSYKVLFLSPTFGPGYSSLPGKACGYRSITNVSSAQDIGVTYAQASANGWVLKTSGGSEVVNPGYTENRLGDIGLLAYQQAWCANTEAWLVANNLDGFYCDDSHVLSDNGGATAQPWHGAATPAKYPTMTAFYNALLSACVYVGNYFRSRGYYVAHNASWYISGDPLTNTGERRILWWKDIAPYSDGLMMEGYMRMLGAPVRRKPTVNYHDYFEETRKVHQFARGSTVNIAGTNHTLARPIDMIALEQGSDSEVFEQRYTLAAFLLDWNGTLGYHAWWQNGDPWNPAMTAALALGGPTGAPVLNGNEYTRQFEHGVVRIDPVAGTASIT